ncbi:SDR family NAD(P)-dependent oxidoreductase [Tessaracoccus coleopterorum]|uniref:SDR family NAD(P)-dependent oxidoreductase n=1 Tax=Tessaracoccus coleopterorum TaxID=2714950 RepID=UPI002F91030D
MNSAGIGAAGTVLENDVEEWQRVLGINVIGMANVVKACLPHLIASPAASVVNVSSAVALTGFPNRVLYTASKGAVLSMTRAMAVDHLADGVRFNAVCPGTTETPWIGRLLGDSVDPAAAREALEARQPHHRLISAEEVAEAVAYLAGPRSASTNGVALSVDAGIESLYVAH